MSDLDEELYGLIADEEEASGLNELEIEQKLAEEAEKNQIKEDKRKLAEMLRNRGGKTRKNRDTFESESGESSGEEFLVKEDSDDVTYRVRDKRERSETKPPDLAQLNSIRISRNSLIQIVFRSDFEDIVVGSFVRIPVREGTCRICEVIEVVDHKMYNLTPDLKTQKCLMIRYGTDKTRIYMDTVSNQPFISDEWTRWMRKMQDDIKRNPTEIRYLQEEEVEGKKEVLHDALNKHLTEEELAHIINERKKTLGENATLLKLNLKRQLTVAISHNDKSEIQKLKQKLSELGEKDLVVEAKSTKVEKRPATFERLLMVDLKEILGDTDSSLDNINIEKLLKRKLPKVK
eukprot:NODE_270_length_11220_cov_0.981387.p2 type:complete len:347 gc:universal NODE_270_length_11220_cov_0.981387:11105-10065(-)